MVAVDGTFDMTVAPQVKTALAKAASDADNGLVVDLSGCDFIDSTGLSTLLAGARALPGAQGLALASPPESEVRRMLELVGITLTVPTFDTPDEAIAAGPGAGA